MKRLAFISACILVISGCTGKILDPAHPGKEFDKVMILYSAGHNDLSSYISGDIKDLKEGVYVPSIVENNALLLVTHTVSGSYDNLNPAVMARVFKSHGEVVTDTIRVFGKGELLTDPAVMKSALTSVRNLFPSSHYSLVMSSHGSGWLPERYYSTHPGSSVIWSAKERRKGVEYSLQPIPGPMVKTFGAELPTKDTKTTVEMAVQDLPGAIPMHLDRLIFDACLMGGVEVAYELRDVADEIGFSQTEILADGLDYRHLAARLLMSGSTEDVCGDYMALYNSKSGWEKSATFSVVRTDGLERLAVVCSSLFGKYGGAIAAAPAYRIQRYYRSDKHWFFDLEDIFRQSGISDSDMQELQAALAGCVVRHEATEEFMKSYQGFVIERHCGLSMYLPSQGDAALDTYYKTLGWNKATSYVK